MILMKPSLSNLFTGRASFKVLELLSLRTEPVRLRTLTELSGMYVHSIELALTFLQRRKVVVRTKKQSHPVYSLNWKHPQAPLLKKIFNLVAEEERQHFNATLDKKAKDVLAFSDSAIRLFNQTSR